MKLSLDIIEEHIKDTVNITFSKHVDNQLSLSRPIFYTGQKSLQSHILYIAKSEQLNRKITCEKHTAVLVVGMPADHLIKKADNILAFDPFVDLFSLSNAVNQIFNKFDVWEKDLLSTSYGKYSRDMFQSILDVSSNIFDNGLAVMNNTFNIVSENKTNISCGGYNEMDPERASFIPSDIVNYFKFDKNYQRIIDERNVFFYEGDILPHRVLCKNIFLNDIFLFRIIITECIRPFRKTDELLLEFLSDHFLQCLKQLVPQNPSRGEGLSHLLAETLDSGKINHQAIESELLKLSWTHQNIYRIASIHASSDDLFLSTLHYYTLEFMNNFPGTFAFQYQDTIVVVINETKAGSSDKYSKKFSLFVRENNFRVGISNFTNDLYKIQTMHRQAEMALTIGLTEKPMEWIHWFSKYTLPYIYNMLRNNSELGQLYSPIYYRLELYDKENSTSYLQTLKVYLNCRMNTLRAAKELFIQRSTMIYRLKRIREITDNDLKDNNDLLHLYLTISIIDHENQRKVLDS